jgi:hypothetical protein
MTIDELETALSTYKIQKPRYKREEEDGNPSLPFMLSTFREMIIDNFPPFQVDFINNFRQKYPTIYFRGIVSRLKRAYLSYVREYHLGFILKKYFNNVVYSLELDIGGIDYVIYYKRRRFNIHAYVNTKSGKYWRGVKNDRHDFRGIHLDLPFELGTGKRCGEFILYNDSQVLDLKARMDKIIQTRNKAKSP